MSLTTAPLALNEELNALNAEARELERVINYNVGKLVGDD